MKSACFQKALQKVVIGPDGKGIFHGSGHGASSSEARPPPPHLNPRPPASGRAAPTNSPPALQPSSFDSLTGCEKEDTDAELSEGSQEDH